MIQPKKPSGCPASAKTFREIASSSSLLGGTLRSSVSATCWHVARSDSRNSLEDGTIFKCAVLRRRERRFGLPSTWDSAVSSVLIMGPKVVASSFFVICRPISNCDQHQQLNFLAHSRPQTLHLSVDLAAASAAVAKING